MDLTPPERIPVPESISEGFNLAWRERYALAWPALALFLIQLFVARFGPPPGSVHIELDGSGQIGSEGLLALAIFVLTGLLGAALTVGIQRRVLLGEQRTGVQLFNFGAPLWRYLLAGLIVCVAVLLPVSLLGGLTWLVAGELASPWGKLFKIVGGLAILYVALRTMLRLTLTFPAASIGLPDRTETIWRMSKHVWWHLLGITLLIMVILVGLQIPTFLFRILDTAIGIPDPQTAPYGFLQLGWFAAIWTAFISVASTICGSTIFSLCYRDVMGTPSPH